MNREAVALGTPVYTTFTGRMGAVDERLVARGTAADARERGRRSRSSASNRTRPRATRDPALLLDLLLTAL